MIASQNITLLQRPLTHVLYWRCELQNVAGLEEYKIRATCKACRGWWETTFSAHYLHLREIKEDLIESILERIAWETDAHHKQHKSPDVHMIKPRLAIPLWGRHKLTYACDKESIYPSDDLPIRLEGTDDAGEGFTMMMEKLTCEYCVAATFDPLLALHARKR